MPNEDRRSAEATNGLAQVIDVIGQADQVHVVLLCALAVPAQTERMHLVTLLGEKGKKMLVPHPSAAEGTVYEQ